MSLDEQDKGLWKVIPKEQVEKLEKDSKWNSDLPARTYAEIGRLDYVARA